MRLLLSEMIGEISKCGANLVVPEKRRKKPVGEYYRMNGEDIWKLMCKLLHILIFHSELSSRENIFSPSNFELLCEIVYIFGRHATCNMQLQLHSEMR